MTAQLPPRRGGRWARLAPLFFGILIAAALVAAILHFADLQRFMQMLRRARPEWLIVALAFQASTYVSVALGWQSVLRAAGSPQRLRRLIPLAVSKLFADQVIPSAGMSGNMLLVDQLVRLGTPRSAAVAALLVSVIGFYAAFAVLAFVMLLLLWSHHEATPLLTGLVTIFLLLAAAIAAAVLWLRKRGSRPMSPRLARLPVIGTFLRVVGEAPAELVRSRPLIARVAAFNAAVFIADAATLQACLFALGEPADFATAFIAFISASIVVTMGPIPMGLGSFEATSTGMLRLLGIPVEAAFTGTLLLRGFTLWLPLVPGMILARGAMKRASASRETEPLG